MALTSGTRLGPYEIVAPLGAGGMGEVYRATDSRLGRDVAIKVLPQHLSANPEVRARFEREAKTISSLNHPNICTLHDVGREGETDFLVMELVEGETLADKLAKGPLATAEVLRIGSQVADALDRAHRAGVVHRDLKPGNVMLTKLGAKLMDFGLARASAGTGAGPISGSGMTMGALTNLPTRATPLTAEGAIVGTFQYMSPEQLEGREADARSDIWALGCVLYEMVTGRRAFDGKSQASLIGAIMTSEPPTLSSLTPLSPAALERAVKQCLAKDADERWQTASDLRRELAWIAEGGSGVGSAVPPRSTRRAPGWVPLATAAAALALGTFLGARVVPLLGVGSQPKQSGATRVTSMIPLTDLPGRQYDASLSPDGKSLLFVSVDGGDEDIFLQRVGGENPLNLTASHDGADFNPTFSPDGETIAFCSARNGGGIFTMGATGESPKRLTSDGAHPAWSHDGRKLAYDTERIISPYGRSSVASLWVVDVATGGKQRIYEGDAAQPAWSPSGQRIAFWAATNGQRDLRTIPARGGKATDVIADAPTDWQPLWTPDGKSLLFMSDRGGSPDLWRVGIDEASGQVRGQPEPITTGVARVMGASISADGQRVAIQIGESRSEILKLGFDLQSGRATGSPIALYSSSSPLEQLRISKDGSWLTYRTTFPQENIYVMRSDGTNRRRVTDDDHRNRGPHWLRGNDWLTFYSNRTGTYQLWLTRADGTEQKAVALESNPEVTMPVASPDGTQIAFAISTSDAAPKLALVAVTESWFTAGSKPPSAPIQITSDGMLPIVWSPDGKFLAGSILTAQGSRAAVYSLGSKQVEVPAISEGMTTAPTWLPDSRRILGWDTLRNTAFLFNIETKTSQDLSGIPGPSDMSLSGDGRTLIVNQKVAEGDIWMLTLK